MLSVNSRQVIFIVQIDIADKFLYSVVKGLLRNFTFISICFLVSWLHFYRTVYCTVRRVGCTIIISVVLQLHYYTRQCLFISCYSWNYFISNQLSARGFASLEFGNYRPSQRRPGDCYVKSYFLDSFDRHVEQLLHHAFLGFVF